MKNWKKKCNIDQKFIFLKLNLETQYIIEINFLYIKTHCGYYAWTKRNSFLVKYSKWTNGVYAHCVEHRIVTL